MARVQGHWTLYFPLETTWQSPTLIPTREDNLSISTHTWAFVWWGSHDQKEMSYSKTSFPYSLIVRWWSHWLRRRPLLDPTSCMCTHSKTVEDRKQLAKYANNVSKLLHTVCEQICYHLKEITLEKQTNLVGKNVYKILVHTLEQNSLVGKFFYQSWYYLDMTQIFG